MKKTFLIILFTLIIFPVFVSGQYATRQAGIRAGYRGGIFYQLTHEAGTAEIGYNAMLGFSSNGVQLTGLRIVYETTISSISPSLFFAWGYGGHAGFIYTDNVGLLGEKYYFQRSRFCPVIGADGWIAAEYRVQEIPLNISLNIKPFVELTVPSFIRVIPFDVGLSISYVF